MRITKSLQQRVIVALDKGQTRVRCFEKEYDDAVHFGIVDPNDKTKFVIAFEAYIDIPSGFFGVFSEKFKAAAKKAWKINPKEGK